jgi:hypothetical protein
MRLRFGGGFAFAHRIGAGRTPARPCGHRDDARASALPSLSAERSFARPSDTKIMQFHIITHAAGADLAGDPTFTLDRVWASKDGRDQEVSHLLDRTYGYRSVRELKWHLAARFGLSPRSVAVEGR